MKRVVATVIASALAIVAIAQAPFTIVRPVDGAKVREKVRVQIPKGAIPDQGYVGVFLDGKFVEGRILDLVGNNYEYVLDTKARRIRDGKHKLELILYSDFSDRPRVLDRTSIDIEVANTTSIPVPAGGFLLRYNFQPGREYPFLVEQKVKIATISEAQARMGGRAATLDVDGEKFRMLYAVDNKYSDGDGLVRMQPIPMKGKDYAIVTIENSDGPKRYYDYEMHPLYMRLTNTGFQEFGSAPFYLPLEGTSGEKNELNLYASLPLPTLPTRRVRQGDSWPARFQFGTIDLENIYELNSLVQRQTARGELQTVEWEMGRPCVKIKHTISVGTQLPGRMAGAQTQQVRNDMGRDRVQFEETFWFAMDIGMVIKQQLDITMDQRVADAAPTGGGSTGAGRPQQGGGGRAGASGGALGAPGDISQNGPAGPASLNQGRGGRGGGRPGDDGEGAGALGNAGAGQSGAGGGRQGGPAVGAIRYNRTQIQRTMTLDL